MPGETDVVNVALHLIGGTRIVDLGDGTKNANIANDIYTEVRDNLLRSHPWNFATKRVQLAQLVATPAFEFDFAYALPADWIRTISVHHNDAGFGTLLYRAEFLGSQRVIVASADQCWMRYIYQVEDPNQMDPAFRRALELSLAKDLSIALASSNRLQNDLDVQATRAINAARSADAMGAFPEMRPRGSWARSRGGRARNDFLND